VIVPGSTTVSTYPASPRRRGDSVSAILFTILLRLLTTANGTIQLCRVVCWPAHRPVGTVESEMRAAPVDRRWASSSSSADATATASRTFYANYARLQGELATAEEAAVLDKNIEELAGKLDRAPAVRAANPQAEVIVRLVHLAREDARRGMRFSLHLPWKLRPRPCS
jgi:hypothetical protein